MLDDHSHTINWGLWPVLFKVFGFDIHSYPVMIILALAVGIIVYSLQIKKQKEKGGLLWLLLVAIVGGTIGAKLPIILLNFKDIISAHSLYAFLPGRTVVGGIIGGTVGVMIARKFMGIKEKRGNLFVPAIAISIAIGRVGCLLQGCCFGKKTSLPWGINFGDGIMRHPTQIYEMIFFLFWFFVSLYINKFKKIRAGLLFQLFVTTYFIFRFLVEYVREEPIFYAGFTLAQIVSLVVILYNLIIYLNDEVLWSKKKMIKTLV